jgi:hypothetical protein
VLPKIGAIMALFDFLYGEGEAVSFIKAFIAGGAEPPEILAALDNLGLTIRKELAQNVIDYLGKTILPDTQYIKQLQNYALPNITRIPVNVSRQARNFNYNVTFTGFKTGAQNISTSGVTVSTNVLLTKQQAMDIAASMVEGQFKSGDFETASPVSVTITQNPAGLVQP